MSWQIDLALKGDLQKFMDAEVRAGKAAVTTIVRRRVTNLKNDIRRQIKRAGLSDRLGLSLRGDTYPKRGASLNAAGRVYSKAIVKRKRGISDLIQVLDKGALIMGTYGRKYVAIANPAVVQLGNGVRNRTKSRSPTEFPPGTFLWRPTKKANVAMLVLKRDPTKVAFWLYKVVRLKKKIDIDRAYQKAIASIDFAVVRQWERNSSRVADKFGVDLK